MLKIEELKEKETTLMYAYFKVQEGKRRTAGFKNLVSNTLTKFIK